MSSVERSMTLSEAFETEAIDFLNTLRSPERRVQEDAWLEDVIASLTNREKRLIYEAYAADNLSEGAAHVLLGDALYAVEAAIEEMRREIEQSLPSETVTPSAAPANV